MTGTIVYLKTGENRVEVTAKKMMQFKILPRM
jgi:hypothetical protein